MLPLFSPGLTWQDDITQEAIVSELSKLRNNPLLRQATPPSPLTVYSKSRDKKLWPAQDGLTRNLQQYLTGLGFLPQAEVGGQPGVQREGASVQVGLQQQQTQKSKIGVKEGLWYDNGS